MEETMIKCLQTAKSAGVPKDQAENLISRGYIPMPWQWMFHSLARSADFDGGPVEIGAGGARGPGKSHCIFSQTALDDCLRVSDLKVLFLRKTAVSAKESFEDLINKIILNRVRFTKSGNIITFANGSRIILGGFNNEDDIDKYVGIEYDLIVVEELNQLTEEKYEKLKGSLRTSKPNWRPRVYASFNPGGRGHAFVKTRFVMPYKLRKEVKTRFVPSTYTVNPYLNKEYVEYLEGLGGDLGRAWREGDFDLFAGQYFTEFKYDIHVIEPFELPKHWLRFRAGDYGFNAPASVGWYAVDEDGNLYRYKEIYRSGLNYSNLADEVVALTTPSEEIDYDVFDPAFWAKKGERDDSLSGAEVYSQRIQELTKKSVRMVKGENSRIIGWGVVREYLKPYIREEKKVAKLRVFSTCTEFIRTIPELQHDERNPEDLDTTGEDHAADELRYAVMSRPEPKKVVPDLSEIFNNDIDYPDIQS